MKKFAIWKNKKVIGYVELTEKQKEELNNINEIGVCFGFDRITNPKEYCNYIEENFKCNDKNCMECPIYIMN